MVIEDNAGDARLIREMLLGQNLPPSNMDRVDRLSEGLDRLAAGGFDAVLIDLGLPDSQGLDTFERVYKVVPNIPILILTANYADKELALEAVRRGAQDYLIKGETDGVLLIRSLNYAVERKKLNEAVKRQAELIDLSPDAIIIKNPDDTITFWNLGAEKLYGWTKEEAIGQKTRTLFKTKASLPIESISEQLKNEGKWSGELFHQTKLGREVAVQSYWLAKSDGHEKIIEILESNVDITERKNAERLAAIGATAGMVGHDIRNPLQSIIGELFLTKEELKYMPESESKSNLKESIEAIETNIIYINKIVTDLQDFAKPASPCIEKVDFENLISSVISMLHVPENIKVIHFVELNFPKILTDPAEMKRILTNLAMNAVQAMPNGGKLTIKASYKDEKAIICVEDTGVGIPKEVKEKIFTPLFTTKAKGQGFGLAVVKKLTESLNGKITLESEVGKGTRFILEFPQK